MVDISESERQAQELSTVAAVDLGSNSFRLQVSRVVDEQIYEVESLREPVRLGAGLDDDSNLDEASQKRATDALSRFAQRLREFSPSAVRAVATNTLRVASNAADVLPRFEAALGFPIEVVAGREEARLIYSGVAHNLAPSPDKRLVVDIGGGSTEFIIGSGNTPLRLESLYMGCVSWTLRYFPNQKLSKSNMKRAELAARIEIEAIQKQFSSRHWKEAVGSSGTASAISNILEGSGWGDSGITLDGLERLRSVIQKAGHTDSLDLPGLRADRRAALPGGVAIMKAIFDELGVTHMQIGSGALRQGVLWDMIGRRRRKDMRESTVGQFMKRYHADVDHARRVERLAMKLHEQFSTSQDDSSPARLLSWAARLHEIGLSVAHSGYHKHSAYILSNADMPGFSKGDQKHLSLLVASHRGSLEKLRSRDTDDANWTLLVALRVAVLMNRSRSVTRLPRIRAKKRKSSYTLSIDGGWLEAHPLTVAELRREIDELQRLDVQLVIAGLAQVEQ